MQQALDLTPVGGQAPVRQVVQREVDHRAGQEGGRGVARLLLPVRLPGDNDVPDGQAGVGRGQAQQQAAGRDLDVVGVGAEHHQGPDRIQGQHGGQPVRTASARGGGAGISPKGTVSGVSGRPWSHTIQGALRPVNMSSSSTRSLNVSAARQKPV